MIELSNVGKVYRLDQDVEFVALKNVDLIINDGELTSIIGPSGSGKSTLMHIIGLLEKPSSGKIIVAGNDISVLNDDHLSQLRSQTIGFVFQQFNLINKLTVAENILLPTIYCRTKLPYDSHDKANNLMQRFGILDKANSFPNRISGGQQQRVAIARALIMNPKLILADEPTGNLDSKTGAEIMKLLLELNQKEGITVIIVTHDRNIAQQTKRIIEIKDGTIASSKKF